MATEKEIQFRDELYKRIRRLLRENDNEGVWYKIDECIEELTEALRQLSPTDPLYDTILHVINKLLGQLNRIVTSADKSLQACLVLVEEPSPGPTPIPPNTDESTEGK
jgi:hypothetical protein